MKQKQHEPKKVALEENHQPQGGRGRVPTGEKKSFVYDIGVEFSSADRTGFDAVRVMTQAEAEFGWLEIGEPLSAVEPDSIVNEGSGGAGSPLLCEAGTTTSGHLPSAESVRAMATTSPWHCRMRTSSQAPPARWSIVPSALRPFHPARLMYARSSVCTPPLSGNEASSYSPAAAAGTCLAGPSGRKPSPHSSRT